MKVLLVSEGKHELGGALEALVRRLAASELELHHAKVSEGSIHTHRGKGQGFYKRAVRWLLEARKRGYEAIALVIDEDGHPERAAELTEAQQYSGVDFPRAFGIAIQAFDAWMLADERALTSVLGCPVHRQPAPEDLANPKQACRDLLAASNESFSQTEMYARIAALVDLSLLEERCAKGFAPFADRVRQFSSSSTEP
jgi:hypothetical protein